MVALTIGMATYNDYDGVYFTLQALRLYHDLTETELLVVDNYGCPHTKALVEGWVGGRYVRATEVQGTAVPRERVFREAQGAAVLCCDSHVLLAPGAIARLKAYYRDHPETRDLLQGPLVYDDLRTIATHFEPVWREQMWGIWGTDARGGDPEGEPFDIWGQGLGVFSCRKPVWPGFHPGFRGFGGEEGYIHEKFRQRGGSALCMPWLRWNHRFGRPSGVPYPLSVEDKLRNYLIGHLDLGVELAPVRAHFAQHLSAETIARVEAEARECVLAPTPELAKNKKRKAKKAKKRKAEKEEQEAVAPRHLAFPTPILPTNPPLVSCILPTYNRPPSHQHLVEEAIESFLRQDYPNKELIVVNDCPEQELVCDAPGVRVVNVPRRFRTLGEKRNFGVQLARGELIAPWDDDDINLPWRLSLSVERLGNAGYFNPKMSWFMMAGKLFSDCSTGVGHNHSLMTRDAFEAVGGYPAISLGEDAEIDGALFANVSCVGEERLPRPEWYYIYRWGVSPAHLSGSSEKSFWSEIGTRPIEAGTFVLHPHWRVDYTELTRELLVRLEEAASSEPTGEMDDLCHPNVGVDGIESNWVTPEVILFVVGGAGPKRTSSSREFPLLNRQAGESKAGHLSRVIRQVDEAVAAGGTHLLVPREAADWLGDHPHLVEYMAKVHELVEADPKTGTVFELRQPEPMPTGEMPVTWHGKPAIWLVWTGNNPLPDILSLCLASVRLHNSADFEVIVVTPENLREYVDPHPAYKYLSLVHRSDYLRCLLLHNHGGVYLDMDTIGLRSLARVYAELADYDLVTYDGAIWGEVFGIGAFGPTRRGSVLTRGWSEAVERLLDRRHDDLAAFRKRDLNPGADCLGWSELCREQVQPVARRLAAAGQLSVRLLEPTWAHVAAGGPAYDELFQTGSPQPPDTELLILNHAMFPEEVRRLGIEEILRSDLGICRLLQQTLGWSARDEGDIAEIAAVGQLVTSRRAPQMRLSGHYARPRQMPLD